ncbi:MAG: Polyphosphate kinase 2 [uncultured Sulfurovum sp.]|uniref:ADP/GDP-polyphosphate phosphotransferase n=1 Tax=uncultured Sulfurovum sp. TaxID=269237 RepID=A0A6S6SD35_9BACT|nr:MAG: Polyphosphate kinase 2 [uncultured Sulfurovum sp.]
MKVKYTTKLAEHQQKPKKVFKKNGNIQREFYQQELDALHLELVKLQKWIIDNDKRLLIIFEGMDTGGKSSSIKALNAFWNPREARSVALSKPNSKELGQWYFQRHLKQIPNEGEIVCFDRSWYNRAGIEAVFGFCTEEEHKLFYKQVNDVEKMLVDDGVMVFKFYLNISHETQAKRIKDRENDPLKSWKLSDLDYKSHENYDKYVKLRDKMFKKSGTEHALWCMLDANDKKRARLNLIRFVLGNVDYADRNNELITGVDEKVLTFFN